MYKEKVCKKSNKIWKQYKSTDKCPCEECKKAYVYIINEPKNNLLMDCTCGYSTVYHLDRIDLARQPEQTKEGKQITYKYIKK